ncbi:HepT-like ribonuclease domain-containing protein [Clostridium beijerinckii]|uniref:HepT-like ribonuclease domain-containing protein n=1 Tax=Clostridium beijerinckii TaxID=1520 RepID=UPI00047B897E|nr:HepT-like ribonuclease domain-containing protein [Clostridium beijerinckii]
MNQERLIKIIEDFQECISDIEECIEILENNSDNKLMIKLAKSSLRQLFVGFHTILEDFTSVTLKSLKKYKIGMTLNDSLEILKEEKVLDAELFDFLEKSRLLRNRISHRYKEPAHAELFEHVVKYKDDFKKILNIAKQHLKE